MPDELLKVADIESMLRQLSEAVERDQIYVDSLPQDCFPPVYDKGLWVDWRRGHIVFIGKLLATAGTMTPAHLRQLSDVASSFDPAVVGQIMLETFAEIVGGCSAAGCETAPHFFEWVAKEVARQGRGKRRVGSARKAMLHWFPAIDPLTIARDPECGYPLPGRRARIHRGTSRPAP